MDINPNKLDELFQRAAEEFRPEAPEHRWPEIEKEIRRKKKRPFGFWLSMASLFLLVGGAGAWLGLSSEKTASNNPSSFSNSLSKASSHSSTQKHPTNNPTKGNLLPPSSIEKSAVHPFKNSNPSASVSTSHLAENSTHQNTSNEHSVRKIGGSASQNTHPQKKKKELVPTKDVENWGSWGDNPPKKKTFLRRNPNWVNMSQREEEKEELQSFEETMENSSELFVALNSKIPFFAHQWTSKPMEIQWKEEPMETEKGKKNLFEQMPGPSWGFVFQPEYVNNWEYLRSSFLQNQNGTSVTTPVNPNFRSSLNNLNHNVGYSLAFQSRFTINVKTSFDLGLGYGFRSDRQNYFECFNPNTGENKLYFQPLTGWNSTAQTFQNSYHYLSLPFGMTHAITGNTQSKGFRLHWNIIPQYLVSGKSMTFDFSKDGFVTGSVSNNSVYNRLGCSAGLGMGYAMKLNSRTLLETGIQWNGNWSTMFNAYYPVDKRFGAIGARFGLVFK